MMFLKNKKITQEIDLIYLQFRNSQITYLKKSFLMYFIGGINGELYYAYAFYWNPSRDSLFIDYLNIVKKM